MSTKKYLVKEVFKKAELESAKSTKNGLSTYLENYIWENYKYSISSKSLSRYYDNFILDKHVKQDIAQNTLDYFAKYIGYENFGEFSSQHQSNIIEDDLQPIIISEEEDILIDEHYYQLEKVVEEPIIEEIIPRKKNFFESIKKQNVKYLTSGGISMALVAGTLLFNQSNTDNACMVWKENHYEEILCDETNPQMKAIPYNENISQLQKITRPDTLNFDNAIGNVWYNKSDGKVEFFTNYGLHPENGKTLKPVSKYILNKYAMKND